MNSWINRRKSLACKQGENARAGPPGKSSRKTTIKCYRKMTVFQTIPILRIFDYQKAVAFYVEWMEFKIMWEHVFEEHSPKYLEVVRDGVTLHLSEHHGDASPGAKIFLWCSGLSDYHSMLLDKKYRHNRPSLEETFYGSWCMEVIDP